MTHACRLSELSKQAFPEFIDFYRHAPKKYPFLLSTSSKSASKSHSSQAHFDILFIEPDYCLSMDNEFQLKLSKNVLTLNKNDLFLDAFDKLFLAESHHSPNDDSTASTHQLPFTGGWFVFFAYELAQQVEPGLKLPAIQSSLPVAYAARVKQALIYDHQQDKLFLVSESGVDHEAVCRSLLDDARTIQKLCAGPADTTDYQSALDEEDDAIFLHSAQKVHHYIKEGDVFQVNLSRLWRSGSNNHHHVEQAASLAQRLAQKNPAPFSGLASFVSPDGYATIISSSPERLLKVKNGKLESRPIAGTRPRSASDHEDQRLLDELHAHPKEQAEHIMLIDLIRNDLGRVCIPGSVVVDELMTNESYSHVHHIVSNVTGKLQDDVTPGEVIKALFPGGTITGCPKVRCMEIIAELEQQARGAYTGSMGYINLDGSMDLNILIRTMLLEAITDKKHKQRSKQVLSFRAGAGLVYDSIAKKELQETRAKAKGMLKVIQA